MHSGHWQKASDDEHKGIFNRCSDSPEGKGTLMKHGHNYDNCISYFHDNKNPRPEREEGKDYFFQQRGMKIKSVMTDD